jgi:hypothetical protein
MRNHELPNHEGEEPMRDEVPDWLKARLQPVRTADPPVT